MENGHGFLAPARGLRCAKRRRSGESDYITSIFGSHSRRHVVEKLGTRLLQYRAARMTRVMAGVQR